MTGKVRQSSGSFPKFESNRGRIMTEQDIKNQYFDIMFESNRGRIMTRVVTAIMAANPSLNPIEVGL